MSDVSSSKSNKSAFAWMRPGVSDFGRGTVTEDLISSRAYRIPAYPNAPKPFCSDHLMRICGTVTLCLAASFCSVASSKRCPRKIGQYASTTMPSFSQ